MKKTRILTILCVLMLLPALVSARDKYERILKEIPFEQLDELQVEIEIGIAELTMGKAKGDNLLEADINYNTRRGEPEIRFKKSGKTGYLTIQSGDRDWDHDDHHGDQDDETWELYFTPKVKIDFEIDIGLVDGKLDMSGMKIINLAIAGGLSDIELDFDEPNSEEIDEIRIEVGLGDFNGHNLGNANFRRLSLECGLGGADLDLNGDWRVGEAEMDVEVGLGNAEIRIPDAIGVEVTKDDNFLSSVDLDRSLREVRKNLYRTSNWDEAKTKLTIDTEVGLGSIDIEIE